MSRETTECHVGPWNGERVLSKNIGNLTVDLGSQSWLLSLCVTLTGHRRPASTRFCTCLGVFPGDVSTGIRGFGKADPQPSQGGHQPSAEAPTEEEGGSLPASPSGRAPLLFCPRTGSCRSPRGSEPADRRAHACSASLTARAAHSSSQPHPPDTHTRATRTRTHAPAPQPAPPREPRDDTGAPPWARLYGCLACQANVGHLAERGLAALPSRLCCKPTIF